MDTVAQKVQRLANKGRADGAPAVRRQLTYAEVLSSWRIDGETRGHTVQETIGFVSELQDVADAEAQRRASPVVFVLADLGPLLARQMTRRPRAFEASADPGAACLPRTSAM